MSYDLKSIANEGEIVSSSTATRDLFLQHRTDDAEAKCDFCLIVKSSYASKPEFAACEYSVEPGRIRVVPQHRRNDGERGGRSLRFRHDDYSSRPNDFVPELQTAF